MNFARDSSGSGPVCKSIAPLISEKEQCSHMPLHHLVRRCCLRLKSKIGAYLHRPTGTHIVAICGCGPRGKYSHSGNHFIEPHHIGIAYSCVVACLAKFLSLIPVSRRVGSVKDLPGRLASDSDSLCAADRFEALEEWPPKSLATTNSRW